MRQPYLRVLHMELASAGGAAGTNPFGVQFSPEDEEEFSEMARTDGFYEIFAKSVAPSIYGSLGQTSDFRMSLSILTVNQISRRRLHACYLVVRRKFFRTA